MSVVTEYMERPFSEVEWFKPEYRRPVIISANNGWLITVEIGLERDRRSNEFENKIVKIARWASRKNKEDEDKRIWRNISSYNIRSYEQWESVSDVINHLNLEDIKSSDKIVSMSLNEANRLYAADVERKEMKQKLSRMRLNITELKNKLTQYRDLISDPISTETKVHNFIKDNGLHWMFGLEYVSLESKVKFPPGKNYFEFDYMLQRKNDFFYDLVELKGPKERLFHKLTKHRNEPNTNLTKAIAQVINYFNAIDKYGKKYKYLFKPKAYVVIGTEKTDIVYDRRLFSSYLPNIDLITYSELYQRGEKLLEYIKKVTP